MPPRKATKKAAAPLDGYIVAISGSISGTTQSALQDRITSLGGTFAKTVNSNTFYVIATEKEVEKNTTKVRVSAPESRSSRPSIMD